MKTLLVMRHAKAEAESIDGSDFSRVLSGRGKKDARSMGKALRKLDLIPDEIFVSTSVRTRETLDGVLDGLKSVPIVRYDESIYEADADTLIRVVQSFGPSSRVMIIGHNPGMERLAGTITHATQTGMNFSTGTLGQFELNVDSWEDVSPGCGSLTLLIDPQTVNEL